MGIAGHLCRFAGCRVVVFLRHRLVVVGVGALVVEGADAVNALVQVFHVARVAAIGVTAQGGGASRGFFPEEESAAGNAVLQGDGGDAEAAVLVDNLFLRGVYGVEDHLVAQVRAEHVQLRL